jgi:hypothetical protein
MTHRLHNLVKCSKLKSALIRQTHYEQVYIFSEKSPGGNVPALVR